MTDRINQTGETGAAENTDRELWREREGDYYAHSIHVTKEGSIGIDCGGFVMVKPLQAWHDLAMLVGKQQHELEVLRQSHAETAARLNLCREYAANDKIDRRYLGELIAALTEKP